MAVANLDKAMAWSIGIVALYIVSMAVNLPITLFAVLAWLVWIWVQMPTWPRRMASAVGMGLIIFGWVEYGDMRSAMGHVQGSHTALQGRHFMGLAMDGFRHSIITTALGALFMAVAGLVSTVWHEQTEQPSSHAEEGSGPRLRACATRSPIPRSGLLPR